MQSMLYDNFYDYDLPTPVLEKFTPDPKRSVQENLALFHASAAFDTAPHDPEVLTQLYEAALARIGLAHSITDPANLDQQ